ncbi:UDP-N-acetylglucosamine--N-acetylmuramyl- pyrophosphoryl-undecaprenol N-acetylglucosamine transferase isoform 3 [Hibiscus syriacus]|uniref:UDP-N-acetylglucosamine--N-acetylmuramyl-pyrophosphoryl-undecaprenol N-acetylglucosamine transferase isoform 3 n=2 Tax=Hibiscus syriacus TaxID=106335 RepID=A0A6A3CGF4_HIBSY|nr:uncharacterized protein LOC120201428 isoform X1 [Hibiscus syriacus]XP_039057970.1 uncharacterized protein LOC120201428 isoform X1 [Hibiscus syriacus]XP_039057971.1 uncharacterized protein LOC120201428 isoform X1 [Hibiscus syriacus]KAE8726199.1 UDP-N-acetylglucosamine--N-acetylmuramyl- pyrophosphoryl-undecaprenol N-acetylglucosamine transferase isoform 3 [Hibiscus syriacus]
MRCLTGAGDSWQPAMTANTTTPGYWFSWRVLLCVLWVLFTAIFSLVLIWKYEGLRKPNHDGEETQKDTAGSLHEDETWRPCLKGIHPAWLMAFRLVAFFVLLVLLIVTAFVDGGSIFYYYTQWTFTLITVYFGLGSLLSMRGCYRYHKRVSGDKVDNVELDAEQGSNAGAASGETSNNAEKIVNSEGHFVRQRAGTWGYVFQIIFQMNAGAVLLTDCVFWFIIVPFLAIKDCNLSILAVNMHTINAVFLLGDTVLNCLNFPCFRIAYFFLWTLTYVIFQWIVHACVNIWWPYPFLDLSSSYAPLWYFSVALLHFLCYGAFALVIKLKHHVFSRWFPESYQCQR